MIELTDLIVDDGEEGHFRLRVIDGVYADRLMAATTDGHPFVALVAVLLEHTTIGQDDYHEAGAWVNTGF